ncbi:cytochrome c biogenesis protein CcdA [Synechococcus sp. M16CYN]|uniref:cytochrome c biogenesis CcdA family protein n=1 Tax=Synechococcus sp. M16CYN TaxID=3103139 RepID=UPI00333EF15F
MDSLLFSDLAQRSEALLSNALTDPGPFTLALAFGGGALTSLGPCSLSLLPVTLAYLAGFEDSGAPWQRSAAFCCGIVGALVVLGSLSGLLGRVYGQTPALVPSLVAVLSVVMGLNLLGLLRIPLPAGPDPNSWRTKVPVPLAPVATGLAFGIAASPCTTPVVAVLLGWVAQSGRPLIGVVLLTSFGMGQVMPLLIAGTFAASVPKLLGLRSISRWVPPLSGVILLTTGLITLIARWS